MTEPAAEPRFDEMLYGETMDELRSPRPVPVSSLLFIVLMLVFLVSVFADLRSVSGVLVLMAVLVFHEAGHALGMRVFGFRDIRAFFIPFFGAAVSGRPRGAAAWKSAMVSLLGPLPGIALGLALLVIVTRQLEPSGLGFRVAQALLLLNAFNLLPLGFLDGGRFLQRVVFSRHRVLEVAFMALGSLALGLIGVYFQMYLLAIFAGLSLGGLPLRWRTFSAAAKLRAQHPGAPPSVDGLGDAEARVLFREAQDALRYPASERSRDVAETMEAIIDAMRPAPGFVATAGLLFAYAAGFACSIVGIFLVFLNTGPVDWKAYEHAGARIEFPRQPLEQGAPAIGGGARDSSWRAVLDGTQRFSFTVREGGGDSTWMEKDAAELAKVTHLPAAGSRAVAIAGLPGREFEFRSRGRVLVARMLATPTRRFEASASAPKLGQNQRRFLDSFTLVDSTGAR